MTNGMIDRKQFDFYGYKTVEVSDGSVQVINPQGLLIARAPSFKEATRIIKFDMWNRGWYTDKEERTDGTEDPFQ